MHFFGIDWVGVNAENGRKLVLSLAFVAVVLVANRGLQAVLGVVGARGGPWEEMAIPITYGSDRARVEAILLDAARAHAVDASDMAVEAKQHLQERFGVDPIDLEPRVYYRITDNWLELTVRFVLGTHQIRGAKDAMSRQILTGLDAAGIGIASATYDIVGLPPIQLKRPDTPRTQE